MAWEGDTPDSKDESPMAQEKRDRACLSGYIKVSVREPVTAETPKASGWPRGGVLCRAGYPSLPGPASTRHTSHCGTTWLLNTLVALCREHGLCKDNVIHEAHRRDSGQAGAQGVGRGKGPDYKGS